MTRDELLSLAEKCEAATGPDRELDAEIARLCFGLKVEHVTIGPDHRREELVTTGRKAGDHAPTSRPISPYTASLDAAMTLVPEGFVWGVEAYPDHSEAVVRQLFCDVKERRGATPALALCAAALRASHKEKE